MANNDLIKKNYKDIADAIRAKTGETSKITADDMPTKIAEGLAKKPAGTKSITENADNIDVALYEKVNVNVPIPPGYVKPTGTKNITANGSNIDVNNYAKVNVSVPIPPGYIYPSGTKNITDNGDSINVREYEYVDVNVSGGGSSAEGQLAIDCAAYTLGNISNYNRSIFYINYAEVDSTGTMTTDTYADRTIICVDTIMNRLQGVSNENGSCIDVTDWSSDHRIYYYPLGMYNEYITIDYDSAEDNILKLRVPLYAQYGVDYNSFGIGRDNSPLGIIVDNFNLDLNEVGDIQIEFYDLTGEHLLCTYTLNQMTDQHEGS